MRLCFFSALTAWELFKIFFPIFHIVTASCIFTQFLILFLYHIRCKIRTQSIQIFLFCLNPFNDRFANRSKRILLSVPVFSNRNRHTLFSDINDFDLYRILFICQSNIRISYKICSKSLTKLNAAEFVITPLCLRQRFILLSFRYNAISFKTLQIHMEGIRCRRKKICFHFFAAVFKIQDSHFELLLG